MKQDLAKLNHARSKKDFPDLSLEENEYVELAIKRSRWGLLFIWAAAGAGLLAVVVALVFLANSGLSLLQISPSTTPYLYLIIMIIAAAVLIAALVSTVVYRMNRLYVTNKRLIHHQSMSLFAKSVNVIDLVSIEDVSFKQNSILDYIFKLGTIRMSTVGDETTYTFKYVDTPTDELEVIIHLVHMEKEKAKKRRDN